jgi:ATP-dependent helicase HrpA
MDPLSLPIYAAESDIVRALTDHRVLVLQGPTGSGKTTQLPKMLQRAMVTDKIIGVTQPRRIAAVSVAWRIADELKVTCGDDVGYAIRFDDCTSSKTRIKIMTDGILLQEARTDPEFSRYGVIVVDEAHERTLNIDVTLGLLHRALQMRSDLRVVVSSATLQPLLFQRYFEQAVGHVPVVSIDARPYPVDVVYKPARSDDNDAIVEAATEEIVAICKGAEPGHVLAFMSGEAAIRQTYEKLALSRLGREVVLLPLYGKLTRSEQERVFDEPQIPNARKVVIATNIAETSITVPGVRFVVDSGMAKVPRFQSRTGISTLFEEGISKASADQRAGRAGRTAPGKCIRLYSKKWYLQRPDFTDEEILRLDLTEVVLRLIDLGVKEVENFPLPTPPRAGALKAAIRMLQTMGAIDGERNLTRIGQRMMPFPLSPPLSRMVVEAADKYPSVVDEVLMVAAFLSAHSPFLYPQGEEAEARAMQQRLAHPLGDAMTAVIALSRYLAANSPEGFAREHYLDPDVMAFVKKAHRQLRDIAEGMGVVIQSGGDPALVVRSVAAGYAHQILRSQGRLFEGMGETPISIHPSSSLFGARAAYVVATEIVVSTRPYARNVSALKPEWVVEANPELAREWRMQVPKKKVERPAIPADAMPKFVSLNGVLAAIEDRRGKPVVRLSTRDIEKLSRTELRSVPPAILGWKAELSEPLEDLGKKPRSEGAGLVWGRPMSLAKWLVLLRHIPLPKGRSELPRDMPVGALLELDRNLHTLARLLPRLLSPFVMSKERQGGWLTLVSNGEGGFWVELVSDWMDALGTTLESARDLRKALPDDDALASQLDSELMTLEQRHFECQDALDEARKASANT